MKGNYNRCLFYLFAIVFLFIAGNPLAQSPEFKHITVDEGLSQNSATTIVQDSLGLLWIGTHNGLNRYNGDDFDVFKHIAGDPNSLADNYINKLYLDKDQMLWICTMNGLSAYDWKRNEFRNFIFDPHAATNEGLNIIYDLIEDKHGKFWLGTGKGIVSFDPETKSYSSITPGSASNVSEERIYCLASDEEENIWFGTADGLFVLKPEDKTIQGIDSYLPGVKSFHNLHINDILITGDYAWIATNNSGLFKIRRTTGETSKCYFKDQTLSNSNLSISHLFEDSKNSIWIGTLDKGIYIIDNETGEIKNYRYKKNDINSISSGQILSVFEDNSGMIWIGTFGEGLNYIPAHKNKFEKFVYDRSSSNTLVNNSIWSFYLDDKDQLWIGTRRGISIYDKQSSTYTNIKYFPGDHDPTGDNMVLFIKADKEKNLWFGTHLNGLIKYDPKTESFKPIRNNSLYDEQNRPNVIMICAAFDKNGLLHIGTKSHGILTLNPEKESIQFTQNSLNTKIMQEAIDVRSMYIDAQGYFWIGTYTSGLIRYNTKTDSINHFIYDRNNESSLGDNSVFSVYEDSHGNIWLGTNNSGLNKLESSLKYENDPEFKHYSTESGFPDEVVYAILEDQKHNLWVSTNNGISRFNISTENVVNFNLEDGLQSKEFNSRSCYIDKEGKMYFGGLKGFNAFYPDSIEFSAYKPSIVITKVKVNNKLIEVKPDSKLPKSINYTKKLELYPEDKVLQLEFVATQYRKNEFVRYAHMLEGFEDNWVYTDANMRMATYTNLDPGTYSFKVKSTNSDGIWMDNETSTTLIVHPPFWKTLWFRILIMALFAGLIYFIVWLRYRVIVLQKEELEVIVDERTKDLKYLNEKLEEKQSEILQQSEELKLINDQLKKQQDELIKQKAELEKYKVDLEELVKERTAELEKAKLKAEESDKLKSAFLANMSHEIRTPMNAIVGFTNLLASGDSIKNKQEYYKMILRSSDNLLNLIDDIIDISKIEAGQLRIEKRNCRISSLVKEVYDMHSKSYQLKKNVDFSFDVDDRLKDIEIYTDPDRIIQVLSNLVSNAIKFTEKGSIKLGYEYVPADNKHKKEQIIFKVIDTGIGIKPENLEVIFDRFRKLESDDAQLYGGSGIGLTISKNLVNLLGGRLDVKSTYGKGSEFCICLPVEHVEGRKPAEIGKRRNTKEKIPDWKNLSILIGEDEEINLIYLKEVLSKSEINILEAKNGQEVIDALLHNPDLNIILLDIKMPEMDGFEAIQEIRKVNTEIPVIAQTAFAMIDDEDKIIQSGFTDYIAKPIKPYTLFEIISKYLD